MTENLDRVPETQGYGEAWTARAVLPATDRAPLAARRVVSTLLIAWGCADQVEVAELVTSELVSNAVRYAAEAGDIEVELVVDDRVIQLSVADGSPEYPSVHPQDSGRHNGLGLHLVERVSSRWGVEDYLLGKRVWLELPLPSARVDGDAAVVPHGASGEDVR